MSRVLGGCDGVGGGIGGDKSVILNALALVPAYILLVIVSNKLSLSSQNHAKYYTKVRLDSNGQFMQHIMRNHTV